MKVIVGDITKEKTVLEAMEGVDVVIHCAALIDTEFYPDEKAMKRVNVDGKRYRLQIIRQLIVRIQERAICSRVLSNAVFAISSMSAQRM